MVPSITNICHAEKYFSKTHDVPLSHLSNALVCCENASYVFDKVPERGYHV